MTNIVSHYSNHFRGGCRKMKGGGLDLASNNSDDLCVHIYVHCDCRSPHRLRDGRGGDTRHICIAHTAVRSCAGIVGHVTVS